MVSARGNLIQVGRHIFYRELVTASRAEVLNTALSSSSVIHTVGVSCYSYTFNTLSAKRKVKLTFDKVT